MASNTVRVTATDDTTITPKITFYLGTCKYYIDEVYTGTITTSVEKSINLTIGQTVDFEFTNWEAVLLFNLFLDAVSGDVSTWGSLTGIATLTLSSTHIGYGSGGSLVTFPLGAALLDNCGLSQEEVDRALSDCVDSGLSNKVLDIGGNNSAPSSAGLADVVTLVSRGWFITKTTSEETPAGYFNSNWEVGVWW